MATYLPFGENHQQDQMFRVAMGRLVNGAERSDFYYDSPGSLGFKPAPPEMPELEVAGMKECFALAGKEERFAAVAAPPASGKRYYPVVEGADLFIHHVRDSVVSGEILVQGNLHRKKEGYLPCNIAFAASAKGLEKWLADERAQEQPNQQYIDALDQGLQSIRTRRQVRNLLGLQF